MREAKASRPPAGEYAELLVATAAGDRVAFRALHDRVGPILLRVCMRVARDRELKPSLGISGWDLNVDFIIRLFGIP